MNTNLIEDKIIASFEGELSEEENNELIALLKADKNHMEIWENYKLLYNDIEELPDDLPGLSVRRNFSQWLETEAKELEITKEDSPKIKKMVPWAKWAGIAAIFVCVLGFWQLYDQNQQLGNSLAHLEAMMEVKSPTERIKAIRVNYNEPANDVDSEMIKVLVNVLRNDKSSNVRLAAVESLSNYVDRSEVREALIKTIATEQDGVVKLEIIHSLGKNQTEEIKSTFEQIVNDDSQEKFVIDRAHLELIRLDSEEF